MTIRYRLTVAAVAAAILSGASAAAAQVPSARIDAAVDRVMPEVVAWRRDLHQHPELGFAETRTAGVVADHLRALGWRCARAWARPAWSASCGAQGPVAR